MLYELITAEIRSHFLFAALFFSLLDFPQMASDVINAYSSSAYILVCFSIGMSPTCIST